jgi:hypothetical protein
MNVDPRWLYLVTSAAAGVATRGVIPALYANGWAVRDRDTDCCDLDQQVVYCSKSRRCTSSHVLALADSPLRT